MAKQVGCVVGYDSTTDEVATYAWRRTPGDWRHCEWRRRSIESFDAARQRGSWHGVVSARWRVRSGGSA